MACRADKSCASQPERVQLEPFQHVHAPLVVSWVLNDQELFWLAPHTVPPLAADKVIGWRRKGYHPYLLWSQRAEQSIGYGELNHMANALDHLWLGHVVVAPVHRNRGYGQRCVELLLDNAFGPFQARQVSLVVFPENVAAVQCYRRAGLAVLGEQNTTFETTRRRHRMLRMGIDRRRYEELYRSFDQ